MDERNAPRQVVDLKVSGTFRGEPCCVSLYDLSMDGCMVDTGGRLALRAGDTMQLDLPHAGATEATFLWTQGKVAGAKFSKRLHQAVVTQLGFRPSSKVETEFRDGFGRIVTLPGKRFSL
jgi:hypothetical protein